MIGSGDLQHWLIVKKSDLIGPTGGSNYANQAIPVIVSSISCDPYGAKWYRRFGLAEDPWVSVRNHGDAAGQLMVYGGNSVGDHTTILANSGGMNVYIRSVPSCSRSGIGGEIGSEKLIC